MMTHSREVMMDYYEKVRAAGADVVMMMSDGNAARPFGAAGV